MNFQAGLSEYGFCGNEDYFDMALNSVSFGVAFTDFSGKIIYSNRKFNDFFNIDTKEPWFNQLDLESRGFIKKEVLIKEPLSSIRREAKIVSKDEVFWIQLEVNLVRPAKYPRCLVFTVEDVSERKKIEQLMREAIDASEAGYKTKSAFLTNISHELKTPLNGIIGFLHLLRDTSLSKEQEDYLKIIIQSSQNLLTVLDDIIQFSDIEKNPDSLNLEAGSLIGLIEEVLLNYSEKAKLKGINIFFQYFLNQEQFCFDYKQVSKVLSKLIDNAIKFTNKGHVLVKVEAMEKEKKPWIKFNVIDTGIGIPPEKQPVIFDPFTQADTSSTRQYGGAGLGLALCKHLVMTMRGEIQIESAPKETGTCVWFTLPLEETEEEKLSLLKDTPLVYVGNNLYFMEQLRFWRRNIRHIPFDEIQFSLKKSCDYEQIVLDLKLEDAKDNQLLRNLIHSFPDVSFIWINDSDKLNEFCAANLFCIKRPFLLSKCLDFIKRTFSSSKTKEFSQLPVLDLDFAIEVTGRDYELLEQALNVFSQDFVEKIKFLKKLLDIKDIGLERLAHTLKGSASYLGAKRLEKICEGIEISARNQCLEEASVLCSDLEYEVSRFFEEKEKIDWKVLKEKKG